MRTHLRTATSAVLLSAALLAAHPAPAGAALDDYMPDSLVKKGRPSTTLNDYKGFATFSPQGQGQTVNKRVRPGGKAVLSVGYRNAGIYSDDLKIRGCGGFHGLKVRYFMQGLGSFEYNVNITKLVRAGMIMSGVAPGSGYGLLVKVKIPKNASPGWWWSCKFGVWSQGAETTDSNISFDVTKWKVKVPR